MKKNAILLFFALTVGSAVVLTTGCSKDDTTAPVITLTGDASVTLTLNSAAWSDPGATANDEEDGTVTVTSDASSTNPNVNVAGVYTVTYTATDAAGNVGTAVRTITVRNEAEAFAGIYDVHDTTGAYLGIPAYDYVDTITIDAGINNRIHFARFGDYSNNSNIYANRLANGNLEIPTQTATGIGSLVETHTFNSVFYLGTATGFALAVIDVNNSNGNAAATLGAIYTKR
jgi:hypothetical protein